jgi:hypothetical protein
MNKDAHFGVLTPIRYNVFSTRAIHLIRVTIVGGSSPGKLVTSLHGQPERRHGGIWLDAISPNHYVLTVLFERYRLAVRK